MRFISKIKRMICCFIEKIRLSESDYSTMKTQSQMYQAMMSTIRYKADVDYEDVFDTSGNLITRLFKSKTITMHINVTDMLAEGGITFDKNAVKLDITGI